GSPRCGGGDGGASAASRPRAPHPCCCAWATRSSVLLLSGRRARVRGATRSPAGEVHRDALVRSQGHQPPGLHGRAGDPLHAPRLGQRRQHEEPFHPRKPFAETLARPPAKGEIGIAGGASLGWGRPSGRDERLWLGKKACVVMHEVRAEEEEGPWG